MDQIGIGLIGCGPMGMSLATNLLNLDSAQIPAVADVDDEKRTEAAEKLEATAYADHHELLARDDVQGVLVAVPQFLHCEITVDAAAAGKHVFTEKPMATCVAECDRMIAAGREHGVKLMVGQVCRFHPVHSKIQEIVASGQLGKPTCMKVHRIGGPWGQGTWARDWRMSMKKSGGILMEIDAHEIDFMRFVCGDVETVYAVGGIYHQKEADYPDIALVSMKFRNGAVGVLHASQATAIGGYGGHVDCEQGSIDFPVFWGEGGGLKFGKFGEEPTFIAAGDIEAETPVQHEVRLFVEAIRDDTPVAVPGEEGRAAIEIAEAAYRSIETGQPIALPLTG